jgi:hypothetical protein
MWLVIISIVIHRIAEKPVLGFFYAQPRRGKALRCHRNPEAIACRGLEKRH